MRAYCSPTPTRDTIDTTERILDSMPDLAPDLADIACMSYGIIVALYKVFLIKFYTKLYQTFFILF